MPVLSVESNAFFSEMSQGTVDVIVPTIGRAESLTRLLESLVTQSRRPDQVIVADGSEGDAIQQVIEGNDWASKGLQIQRLSVLPPNAVRQRQAAISRSNAEFILLLDDDVVLESDCIKEMLSALDSRDDLVAVSAIFNNQPWSYPTTMWRFYLRMCGVKGRDWQGRVLGPLLRFGYIPCPTQPMPMEWLGTCNSLVRRGAYEQSGGFSDFFLHRCTMNEDVDLGIKLNRIGRIVLCPNARLAHLHAPGGRVSTGVVAEDDLYNRYLILRRTQRRHPVVAVSLVLIYFLVESLSDLSVFCKRLHCRGLWQRFGGRLRALTRIPFAK